MLLYKLYRVNSVCIFEIVNISDIFFCGSVTEKPCKPLQYSVVVWHGLTSDDRRNVSGSTGRIPQSCATRSQHWQESATYFSMRTAALRLCLIALLYLFLILLACLSLSLSPPPRFPLSGSKSFFLPFHSLPLHHFIFCSSCSLFVCLGLSLVSLLVNLSVCLSGTPSILLSYFASCFSQSSFCLLFVPMHVLRIFLICKYSCLEVFIL